MPKNKHGRSKSSGAGGGKRSGKEVIRLNRDHAATLNLATLQRGDSSIQEVVCSAAHVVVYECEEGKGWEKKGAEGGLFLVRRSKAPHFRLVVLNRLSPRNFVAALSAKAQVAAPQQYLMIRDKSMSSKTIGFWFADVAERNPVQKAVTSVTAMLKRGGVPKSTATPGRSGGRATAAPSGGGKSPQLSPSDATAAGANILAMIGASATSGPAAAATPPPVPAAGSGSGGRPANNITEALAELAARKGAKPRHRPAATAPTTAAAAAASPSLAGLNIVLSRSQLKEALVELLQDDSFVETVHAAYLRGVTRRAQNA